MSVFEGQNRSGRCALCEEPTHKILTQYPINHPFAGEARSLGKPFPLCRLVTLILMNGHQCDITMCEDCANHPHSIFSSIVWKRLLKTWKFEMSEEFRKYNNIPPPSKREKDLKQKWFEKIIHNVPVGVLSIRKGDQNG